MRPGDLRQRWPWLLAGTAVVVLALSPLLGVIGRGVAPPYAWTQQASRTAAGPLTAAFVAGLWLYASRIGATVPLFTALREPLASHRSVLLALAMLAATVPWAVLLYARYLEVVRTTIRAQSGPIPLEDTIFEWHPRLAQHDAFPDSLSLLLRTQPTDGLIVPLLSEPRELRRFDWTKPPDLSPFRWRE